MEAQTLKSKQNWWQGLVNKYQEQYFGATVLMMTLQSCLGGVVAMAVMEIPNYFLLAIVVAVTMACNAVFIAQVEAKTALKFFVLSIAVNCIVGIISLIM